MKKVTLNLGEKQIDEVKEIAEYSGLNYSEHIRRAIDMYIKYYWQENKKEKSK